MPRNHALLASGFAVLMSASADPRRFACARAGAGPAATAASRRASRRRKVDLTPAPNRRADEGRGPFKTLVIRGVMLIDGTGAPPTGPGRRRRRGQPHRVGAQRRHAGSAAARRTGRRRTLIIEIDATGMYLMPGFVDMHVHAGGAPKNADAEYAYKLWLAHGVTTVRGVPLGDNASPSARSSAARRTKSSRRASSTISAPAAAGTRVRSTRPRAAASTCAGRRRTASTA